MKHILALASLIATLFVGCTILQQRTQNGDAGWTCWEKSAGGNGHYYKAVAVTNGIAWMHANKLARKQRGYLATITSVQENEFVFKLVKSPEFFTDGYGPLLGGFQPDGSVEPNIGWCWVTGEAWTYANWRSGSGEPNNSKLTDPRGEDGLMFYSGGAKIPSPAWADIGRNDSHTGGYVIERGK